MGKTLEELIKWAKEYVDKMSPEEKEAMMQRQRESWVRAEAQWAQDFAAGKCERD